MTESKTLFDPRVPSRKKAVPLATHALYQEAARRLQERLEDVKQPFTALCDWDVYHTLRHSGQGAGATPTQREPESRLFYEGRQPNAIPDHFSFAPVEREEKNVRNDSNVSGPFDLVTSCLALQAVNHVETELGRILSSLKEGGLFLAVLLGGQTLHELHSCLIDAEIDVSGGASPRIAPLFAMEDLSRLLVNAGFALPVVDHERVQLVYPDIYALMHDLRAHGCTNNLGERTRHLTRRALFEKANMLYKARFPAPAGGILATADLVFLHGWRE